MQENNQTNNSSVEPDTTTGPTPNPAATASVEVVATENNTTTEVVTETVSAPQTTVETVVANNDVVASAGEVPKANETVVAPATGVNKQLFMQYGIATLVVLVMGVGLVYALEQQGRISTGVFTKVSELVNPAPAAATVNGTKITKAEYEKNLLQLQNAATAQGADPADESVQAEIKKQAIDVLVNTELLRQEARKDGIEVTQEKVEARYQEILTSLGSADALAAKMTELGITEASLRKDIEGEILIQGHLSKAVDTSKITVTPDELKAAYEQITATAGPGATIPPLAEISTQLEAQLKTNKEQELVNAYITKVREGAEIEVLI